MRSCLWLANAGNEGNVRDIRIAALTIQPAISLNVGIDDAVRPKWVTLIPCAGVDATWG